MATQAQKQEFIQKMWQAILNNRHRLQGLFPSVIIVQSGFESGWGQDLIAKNYHNYFGFKVGKTEPVYSDRWCDANGKRFFATQTPEYKNGKKVYITDKFRVYDNMEDSLVDRNALIFSLDRYKAALSAKTPLEQLQALQKGEYSTSPTYANDIWKQIQHDGLTRYDELLQQALAEDAKKKSAKAQNKPNSAAKTGLEKKERKLKGWHIGLIVVGSLALVGGVGYLIWRNWNNEK